MNCEKQLLSAVYTRAAVQGRVIRRAETMKTGTPDVLLETNNGLVLVELKFAKTASKILFSEIQQYTIKQLNVRSNKSRAVGLIVIARYGDVLQFIVDDKHLFGTAEEYLALVGDTDTRSFDTFEEAFDYIVQVF